MEGNCCLTLTEDFKAYCKLNAITDIQTFAQKVFDTGFNVIKYGNSPKVPVLPPQATQATTPLPEIKPVVIQKDNLYGE